MLEEPLQTPWQAAGLYVIPVWRACILVHRAQPMTIQPQSYDELVPQTVDLSNLAAQVIVILVADAFEC